MEEILKLMGGKQEWWTIRELHERSGWSRMRLQRLLRFLQKTKDVSCRSREGYPPRSNEWRLWEDA